MNSKEIRQVFLDFYQKKQHQIVASAPMVIKNDPTLMFTNAGMNQFKDLFLGNSPIKYNRISDSQKCLRVSGKHNDLEEVGVDTYHHTMFEMLGNWSFGDYFKKESIEWAWELLVDVYKVDKTKLYFTVFEGDETDKTEMDSESYDLWKAVLERNGLTEDKILKANKKDNFWEMGETGPCGPCSEIHVDLRSDEERAKVDGGSLVNEDHPEVIEIWNLVFIQFERKADRSLVDLPAKHIDTGMGFERITMALQNKTSSYDTDLFEPTMSFLEKTTGLKYEGEYDNTGATFKKDMAFRVLIDHIRAVSFAIADGQLPSNTGAGYVIRRILRRAVRYYYSFLDLKKPVLYQLMGVLADQFKTVFLELDAEQLHQRMYTKRSELGPDELPVPVKLVHLNKCPILAPAKTLTAENAIALNVDREACLRNLKVIRENPEIRQKLIDLYSIDPGYEKSSNVDTLLYDGFFSHADKTAIDMIRQSTPEQLIDFEPNVSDPRIKPLLFRYRARNFPHTLNESEQLRWQAHLQDYFETHMPDYETRFESLYLESEGNEKKTAILRAVYNYVQQLVS